MRAIHSRDGHSVAFTTLFAGTAQRDPISAFEIKKRRQGGINVDTGIVTTRLIGLPCTAPHRGII